MPSEPSPSRSEPGERLDLDGPVPGTWALVGLVVGAYVAGGIAEIHRGLESPWSAFVGPRSLRMRIAIGGQDADMIWHGDAHQLWTSVLVHTDLLHLLANAVALYALGRLLEPMIGARRLWSWFWIGGVLASLTSWAAGVPQSDGASGGAFALLGVALVLGNARRPDLVPEDARLVGPVLWGFTALNLVLSAVLPFVDLVAHLAGLLAGLLLAGVLGTRDGWALRWLDRLWLGACAVMLGLGWFVPDVFRAYFWRVWMAEQHPWILDIAWFFER